jgi:hypothetical protein
MPSSIQSAEVSSEQQNVVLPESISYTATQPDIKNSAQAEVSKTAVDLKIKFDAEAQYKELRTSVDGIQSSISSLASNARDSWLPYPRPAEKFEERPLTEPTNLIFEARRERFSEFPRWA